METKEITIKVLQFKVNSDIILAVDNGNYYVKTSDGVFIYSKSEMIEIYNFSD